MSHLGIEYVESAPVSSLSPEVQKLARDPRRKIDAIKLLREETGLGLKEAKDAIDGFADQNR